MINTNVVILTGNVVKDIEVRATQLGTKVCSFTLAVGDGFYDNNKNWVDQTNFINCVAYSKTAERLEKAHIGKGSYLLVNGSWTHRKFVDSKGQTRYVDECNVNNVEFQTKPTDYQPKTTNDVKKEVLTDAPFGDDDLPF